MNHELDFPNNNSDNRAQSFESKSSEENLDPAPNHNLSDLSPPPESHNSLDIGATSGTSSDTTSDDGDISLEELVRSIAVSLVDQVSRIQISEIQGHQTHIIELKVAKEDIGKVIGRQGRTADAIRTILNCASAKLSKRYILQIIDESKPPKNRT